MRFTKMQGLGNDFLVIDDRSGVERPWPELARRLCDRRRGVGGDGLLLVRGSEVADLRMTLVNADGSEGEMCGNGVRCTAVWAAERGVAGDRVAWETAAGPVITELLGGAMVRVDMGVPRFAAAEIPVLAGEEDLLDLALEVRHQGASLAMRGAAVGMGNPHLVVDIASLRPAWTGTLDDLDALAVGTALQRLPIFPAGVNVELVAPAGPRRVRQRTVERGVGETDACGTGACAAVVALRRRGALAAQGEVEVELRGGMLVVDWDGAGPVRMTGAAISVFEGEVAV